MIFILLYLILGSITLLYMLNDPELNFDGLIRERISFSFLTPKLAYAIVFSTTIIIWPIIVFGLIKLYLQYSIKRYKLNREIKRKTKQVKKMLKGYGINLDDYL